MKLSGFIIAIILVMLVMTTFGLYISDLSTTYETEYNKSDIDTYNRLVEMQNLTHRLQDKTENQTVDVGLTDIVGGYIGDAIDALRLAKNSYSTFEVMSSKAIDQAGLPYIFKIALFSIVLIAIIFAIIGAMIKSDV